MCNNVVASSETCICLSTFYSYTYCSYLVMWFSLRLIASVVAIASTYVAANQLVQPSRTFV